MVDFHLKHGDDLLYAIYWDIFPHEWQKIPRYYMYIVYRFTCFVCRTCAASQPAIHTCSINGLPVLWESIRARITFLLCTASDTGAYTRWYMGIVSIQPVFHAVTGGSVTGRWTVATVHVEYTPLEPRKTQELATAWNWLTFGHWIALQCSPIKWQTFFLYVFSFYMIST